MLPFVTHMGDTALLAPVAGVFAILLWRADVQVAQAWCLSLVLAVVVTLGAKLLFLACAPEFGAGHLRSPSGHASLSLTVLGNLGIVLGHGRRRTTKIVVVLLLSSIAAGVAVSRVMLGLHSWAEVLAGGAIGVLCVALFYAALLIHRPKRFLSDWHVAGLAAGLIAIILGGFAIRQIHPGGRPIVSAENAIDTISNRLRRGMAKCSRRSAEPLKSERPRTVPSALRR